MFTGICVFLVIFLLCVFVFIVYIVLILNVGIGYSSEKTLLQPETYKASSCSVIKEESNAHRFSVNIRFFYHFLLITIHLFYCFILDLAPFIPNHSTPLSIFKAETQSKITSPQIETAQTPSANSSQGTHSSSSSPPIHQNVRFVFSQSSDNKRPVMTSSLSFQHSSAYSNSASSKTDASSAKEASSQNSDGQSSSSVASSSLPPSLFAPSSFFCSPSSPVLYSLRAVIVHEGSHEGGHYICYAYNTRWKRWFCYNDHMVKEITDLDEILKCQAYILFYQRQNEAFDQVREQLKCSMFENPHLKPNKSNSPIATPQPPDKEGSSEQTDLPEQADSPTPLGAVDQALRDLLPNSLHRFAYLSETKDLQTSLTPANAQTLNMQSIFHPERMLSSLFTLHSSESLHDFQNHSNALSKYSPKILNPSLIPSLFNPNTTPSDSFLALLKSTFPSFSSASASSLQLSSAQNVVESGMPCLISSVWFARFLTTSDPGPIDNYSLLCEHGWVSNCFLYHYFLFFITFFFFFSFI